MKNTLILSVVLILLYGCEEKKITPPPYSSAIAKGDSVLVQASAHNKKIDSTAISIDYWAKAHQACEDGNLSWAYGRKTKARKQWGEAKKYWRLFEIYGHMDTTDKIVE